MKTKRQTKLSQTGIGRFGAGRPPTFEPSPRANKPKKVYNPQPHPHAGRPTKEIDWSRVEKDLWRGATVEEVAHSIGVTPPTLYQYDNFLMIYKRAYAKGNISHRRLLWNMAKHVPAVAIFIAKVRLGMNDNSGTQVTVNMPSQIDLKKLNDKQLEQLEHLLEQAEVKEGEKLETIDTTLVQDDEGNVAFEPYALLPEPGADKSPSKNGHSKSSKKPR